MSSNVTIRLTADHILSCFRVGYGSSTGTCFVYSNDNGIFFVTASHVLKGCCRGDRICLLTDSGSWMFFEVKDISFATDPIDVCTFSLSKFIMRVDNDYHRQELSISLGEEVKFLGFPHGLTNTYPANGFVAPLVRTAYFSGQTVVNGISLAIFDGFNNPGYSGGPLYVRGEDGSARIFAIISGYRPENPAHSRVFKRLPGEKEEEIPGYYTKPNSGMIYAHIIHTATDCALALGSLNPWEKKQQ